MIFLGWVGWVLRLPIFFSKAGRLVHELQWRGTIVSLAPEASSVEGLFYRHCTRKNMQLAFFPMRKDSSLHEISLALPSVGIFRNLKQ
jgi:hypothetical protein